MSVIRGAVVTEHNHIVALNKILWIGCRHGLPRFAAVEGHVVITPSAWFRWMSSLKRGRDHVVRILWIDRDRHFSGTDRCWLSNANDLLCRSKSYAQKDDTQ